MINATELRIGNWLNDSGPDFPGPFRIMPGGIADPEDDWEYIPLTEEWLVKFGFTKENLGDESPYEWYKMDGICVWNFNDQHWIYDAADGDVEQSHFKYVHQLQNLYHALTGEELQAT